jgi:hypothetical protein
MIFQTVQLTLHFDTTLNSSRKAIIDNVANHLESVNDYRYTHYVCKIEAPKGESDFEYFGSFKDSYSYSPKGVLDRRFREVTFEFFTVNQQRIDLEHFFCRLMDTLDKAQEQLRKQTHVCYTICVEGSSIDPHTIYKFIQDNYCFGDRKHKAFAEYVDGNTASVSFYSV